VLKKETEIEVISGISLLIIFHLNNAAHEQFCPSPNPDQMDNGIAEGKAKANALRKIREDFENTISGII
jgi:hypothetical protein